VGLDPEAVGHGRAKPAKSGQEPGLADLLAQPESQFGAIEEGGPVFPVQVNLDRHPDRAKEKNDHRNDSEAERGPLAEGAGIFD
jgi:hypothetical protein